MILRAVAFAIGGLPMLALAGGDHAFVTVKEVSQSSFGGFRLVLEIAQKEDFQYAPGCRSFTVEGRWSPFTGNKPKDSGWTEHQKALDVLRKAKNSGQATIFGSMIDGLPAEEGRICRFTSKGLTITTDWLDRSFVLSYAR